MRKLLTKYKDILIYYDYHTLLFLWSVSDLCNNQVLWTKLSFWTELGQPETYYLYMVYLFVSLGTLLTLNKIEWCVRFVATYLMLHVFSTMRYCVDLLSDPELVFEMVIVKNLTVTFVYFVLWCWIYVKMKKEAVHKKVNG